MSLMSLILYILGIVAGTTVISLFLVLVDDMYPSQRKPEWKRWIQAFCISLGCALFMMAATSEWLNDFSNMLCNMEVW